MHSQPNELIKEGMAVSSLREYLKLLAPFLNDPTLTEIIINQPFEVITQTNHHTHYHHIPALDAAYCLMLVKLIASYSQQKCDSTLPILSATLPEGQRVQAILPPAVAGGRVSLTIRQPQQKRLSLAEYQAQGFFDQYRLDPFTLTPEEETLCLLKQQGKMAEFLTRAVQVKKNIIFSGATGSGKTSFLKSLIPLISPEERLISIENVSELCLDKTHPNSVSLFYSAGKQGIAQIGQKELLESALRMKPDRIFLSELIRGEEAFYFLRNVNSGHPGSMTTMHANSATMAIEQLVLFLKEAGTSLSRIEAKDLILMCVDVIVQIHNHQGKRFISEIYYDPHTKYQKMR